MNESAVLDLDELETEITCPGCDKPLNLLKNHLLVSFKVQRNVIETVDPATIGAEADPKTGAVNVVPRAASEERVDEDVDEAAYYLGTRSGVANMVRVHDYGCLKKATKDHEKTADKDGLKLKLAIHDEHAEGRSNE